MPPLHRTPYGLCIAPAHHNFLLASLLPLAAAVGFCIDWSAFPASLNVMDHVIAARILLPLLSFILKSCSDVTDVPADLVALRLSSALIIVAVLVHGLVHILGRTGLLSIVILHVCAELQIACWTASLARKLQNSPLTSSMPPSFERILNGSLLDLLDSRPHLLVWARAFIPVVLLGPGEAREEALLMLRREARERLKRPLIEFMPKRYREMMHAPWEDAAHLRLVRGGEGGGGNTPDEPSPAVPPPLVSPGGDGDGSDGAASVDAAFAAAVEASKGLGDAGLSRQARLTMYSLYKQATVGDAPETCPAGRFDAAGRLKWSAWVGVRGMGSDEARMRYTAEIRTCTGEEEEANVLTAAASALASVSAPAAAAAESPQSPPASSDATGLTIADDAGGSEGWGPEVLLLKEAAKRIARAAKERTTVGRGAVRLAAAPWDAIAYVKSWLA